MGTRPHIKELNLMKRKKKQATVKKIPKRKKSPAVKKIKKKTAKKIAPQKEIKHSRGKAMSARRKKEIEKIVKNLASERLFIQERIEKAKRDEWIDEVNDEIDTAVASTERDILFERVDGFIQRLDEIDNALKKVSLKKFGICEKCGSEITTKRLKLIPYARYCYRCIAKV
ncbi:MAG: hypothetical protein COT16_03550 [Elusimicrobia bacterium CG08_land_8_20_14_0_20_44_26]|nr:MAG: hypothetical protein COT16_03550 [Elusimicrobia bacterium CG08_land_8_20_14_0_20_44_26]